MVEGKVRKRKFAVKLRSGCKTCKRRHVKCDEEQPRCRRCQSSGRMCERNDTLRIAQTSTRTTGGLSLTWSRPLSAQPDAAGFEKLAFKYFQYSCGAIVQNEFRYRPLFEYILQAAQVEPSIWHATVALGSLQKPENAPIAGNGTAFGFSQYGRAIQILNGNVATSTRMNSEIVLATSLLFATFEVLHKEFSKGSQHINGSLNYLCDLVQTGRLQGGIVFSAFVDVFARLAISASIFGGQQTRLIMDPFAWLSAHTLDEKQFSMDLAGHVVLFCLAAMRFLEDSLRPASDVKRTHLLGLRSELLDSIGLWEFSMKQLEGGNLNVSLRHRALLLKIYMTYCKISVSAMLIGTVDPSELRYDEHILKFRKLLDSCKNFMEWDDLEAQEQGGLRYPSFTIHIGIIHILWYVSIKCRDPQIRRQAVKLLNHCHHGEGDTFDGVMIAGYAEMVIRLEEGPEMAATAQDVPAERRISTPYFNVARDDHVLHCEKGDFRLSEEWSKWQPICVFSV